MTTATRMFCAAVAWVVFLSGSASGATYVVKPDESGDFPTIQDAVYNSTDGDTIELADGVFRGDGNRDIQVPSRSITIRSQSGNFLECLIDCEGSARAEHRGFYFSAAVGTGDAMLEGVGIINGYLTSSGGAGIWIDGANPQIWSCAIVSCTVDNHSLKGGGLHVTGGGYAYVIYCLFSLNSAGMGGGVAIDGAWGTFNHCEMVDNTATNIGGGLYVDADGAFQIGFSDIVSNQAPTAAGVYMAGDTPYVSQCNISRNDATGGYGGGVVMQDGRLWRCTLVENSSTSGGGGVHCHDGTGDIEYCLIAYGDGGYGMGATAGFAPSPLCCDVYGNAAGEYDSVVGDQTGINNNFSLDPEFCGWEYADYRLFDTSPCVWGNNPCDGQVGLYGIGCDSPAEHVSWGMLKALWR